MITGSPGTGKTTVLRTILEVYRRLHPDGKIALMAPTGRASRRMSESTGFEENSVWMDRETGVNYLWHSTGHAGGMTPLLDREGKPIITTLVEEKE